MGGREIGEAHRRIGRDRQVAEIFMVGILKIGNRADIHITNVIFSAKAGNRILQ